MGTVSLFQWVKRPGRGSDHPATSSAEVRVQLYLYSPSGTKWPVLGWTSPFNSLDRRLRETHSPFRLYGEGETFNTAGKRTWTLLSPSPLPNHHKPIDWETQLSVSSTGLHNFLMFLRFSKSSTPGIFPFSHIRNLLLRTEAVRSLLATSNQSENSDEQRESWRNVTTLDS
jgi:hypothetical protein